MKEIVQRRGNYEALAAFYACKSSSLALVVIYRPALVLLVVGRSSTCSGREVGEVLGVEEGWMVDNFRLLKSRSCDPDSFEAVQWMGSAFDLHVP